MTNVTELTGKEFQEFAKRGLVLVDFSAEWCMPCLIMAPILEDMAKKFKGKIRFAKIDIDDNRGISEKFKIFSIPNFILFKDGIVLDSFVGSMPEEDFEERLREYL